MNQTQIEALSESGGYMQRDARLDKQNTRLSITKQTCWAERKTAQEERTEMPGRRQAGAGQLRQADITVKET